MAYGFRFLANSTVDRIEATISRIRSLIPYLSGEVRAADFLLRAQLQHYTLPGNYYGSFSTRSIQNPPKGLLKPKNF